MHNMHRYASSVRRILIQNLLNSYYSRHGKSATLCYGNVDTSSQWEVVTPYRIKTVESFIEKLGYDFRNTFFYL